MSPAQESDHPQPPILWRDRDILAMNKPSGLAVHRGMCADRRTAVSVVRAMAGCVGATPIHRLDRGTSGVLLFALSSPIASRLCAAMEAGEVSKTYWALVRGVSPDSVVIDHPVPRSEGGPRVAAITELRRLTTLEIEPRTLSFVEARPKTGRFHQVRRHLKHIGHPIIGDANYGRGELNRELGHRYGLQRLALHARTLCFVHPVTGESLVISAPLPDDLAVPLSVMGLDWERLQEPAFCH